MQRAALDFQRKGNVKELDQLRSRYVQLTLAVKCLDSLLHSRDHYTCISSADDIIFKFNLYVCIIKLVSNVLTSKQMYLKGLRYSELYVDKKWRHCSCFSFHRMCINGVTADDMYNEGKVSMAKKRMEELEKRIETVYSSIKYREVEISKIAGK